MSKFTNVATIVRSMAGVIIGCWAYCLVVAPVLSEGSYAEVAAEKAQQNGIGFTIAALIVGAIWLLIAKLKAGSSDSSGSSDS